MTSEERTISINGKNYVFKNPVISVYKKAKKFSTESKLFTEEIDDVPYDVSESDWNTMCELIFENPLQAPKLDEITFSQFVNIVSSFFVLAKATRTEAVKPQEPLKNSENLTEGQDSQKDMI